MKCWGDNTYGELGDGIAGGYSYTAVQVANLRSVIAIAGTGNGGSGREPSLCAVEADGSVFCWGENGSAQLAEPVSMGSSDIALRVKGLTGATSIYYLLGGTFCAGASLGRVYCWGNNQDGELGSGSSSAASSATPVQVKGLTHITSIVSASMSACAQRDRFRLLLGDQSLRRARDRQPTRRVGVASEGDWFERRGWPCRGWQQLLGRLGQWLRQMLGPGR